MSLREDVKFEVKTDWHPKVPSEQIVMEQAKRQLKKGKSSGNIALDIKAIKDKDEGR